MRKHCFQLPLILLLTALILPVSAAATETIHTLQQKIKDFNNSAAYQFAPSTSAKASAYLGAAMIAEENEEAEKTSEGIAKALDALDEAKENASRFKNQHSELLLHKRAAEQALSEIKIEDPLQEPNPKRLLRNANEQMKQAISFFENGDLNKTQQSADEASSTYMKVIDAALPALINRIGSIISRAAAAGAKKSAPLSYEAAKLELSKMERYADGISQTLPTQPGYALTLAERSLRIAKQVKLWRKAYGSHEMLYLKARDERLQLAKALNIEVDSSDADATISSETLLQAATQLQSTLASQRAAHENDIARLKERHQAELEKSASEQRATLLSDQNEQLSNLKEAFRAKLERETFETKRQKRVRNLFKKGDVELLVNLDGSLLIRLSRLQFAPGSSKVDAAHYKLLGNLKEALDIYGDRNIRIEGHTDSKGDVKINQKISLKRAEAVRDFLVAASMDGSRIKALGYGEVRPIASNEFKKGRAMNRRIDIVIQAQND